MQARYEAAVWPGNDGERARWAVAAHPTGVWYFPRSYGRKAAERMAERMTRDARRNP